MKIARAWEEEGVTIPAPFQRNIKVLFAPDKQGVHEISLNQAIVYPGSQTDSHVHDRPELIYVASGRGIAVCNDKEYPVEADVFLWMEAGDKHQMINTGQDTMKLVTLFVPPYTAEQTTGRAEAAAQKAQKQQG
jgi:mannose-6-phosphate isomerase-like protein (cupin superfamily)